jgi:hypothetical protein
LIDEENLQVVKDIAKQRQYQLFLEYVGTSTDDYEGAILIVDGSVKS